MLQLRRGRAFQLRNDGLGQHLAQLHAPLIEGIDVPNRALGEDIVLVKCDQSTQRPRRQLVGQDRVGGTIAFANPERSLEVRRAFGLEFRGGLAERQGLGLREDVGHQQIVLLAPAG